MRKHGIKPMHLSAESGYSRQHLLRVRNGTMDPTRRCIASVTSACKRLSQTDVRAADLFDLDGEAATREVGGARRRRRGQLPWTI
jgi:hypothetical protein